MTWNEAEFGAARSKRWREHVLDAISGVEKANPEKPLARMLKILRAASMTHEALDIYDEDWCIEDYFSTPSMPDVFAADTATPASWSDVFAAHEEWPNDSNGWTFRKTAPLEPDSMLSAGTPILPYGPLQLPDLQSFNLGTDALEEMVDNDSLFLPDAPSLPQPNIPASAPSDDYQSDTGPLQLPDLQAFNLGTAAPEQMVESNSLCLPDAPSLELPNNSATAGSDGNQRDTDPSVSPKSQDSTNPSADLEKDVSQAERQHDHQPLQRNLRQGPVSSKRQDANIPTAPQPAHRITRQPMWQSRYPRMQELIKLCFLNSKPEIPGTREELSLAQVQAWLDEHWPGCNATTVRSQLSRHDAFERVKSQGTWRLKSSG